MTENRKRFFLIYIVSVLFFSAIAVSFIRYIIFKDFPTTVSEEEAAPETEDETEPVLDEVLPAADESTEAIQ